MAGFLSRNFRRARGRDAGPWRRAAPAAGGLVAVLVLGPLLAAAGPVDPPVPAGRNPGGFPVTVIGSGVDYTLGALAQMLARDGEGEIIGYDFVDDDRRPFGTGDTAAAEVLIREGQAATLVAVRAKLSEVESFGRAISYAAKSPSKIVAIPVVASGAETSALIRSAANHFPERLFIVPSLAPENGTSTGPPSNLLRVAGVIGSATTDGQTSAAFDIAVHTETIVDGAQAQADSTAIARIAALAARLLALEPALTPEQMKTRIVRLAVPMPNSAPGLLWIAEPRRHFWLE
jgi:hypothetical protein